MQPSTPLVTYRDHPTLVDKEYQALFWLQGTLYLYTPSRVESIIPIRVLEDSLGEPHRAIVLLEYLLTPDNPDTFVFEVHKRDHDLLLDLLKGVG